MVFVTLTKMTAALLCVLTITTATGVADAGNFDWGGRNTPTFTPPQSAILIDAPGTLDKVGGYYFLTKDVVADGTAFEIHASNITLDLGGRTVVYNHEPAKDKCYGVYVKVFASHTTIKNGYIIQGEGKGTASPAVYIYGGSSQPTGWQNIHNLIIRTHGTRCVGIAASNGYGFYHSKAHHNYIENHSFTERIDGSGGDCIAVAASKIGDIDISDNILAAGHRGVSAAVVALGNEAPPRSEIRGNLVQQELREGCKSSYGIAIAKCHNIHIHDNQVVSDNGRGIILDGWGQGVPEGCSGNFVYDNLIDVQFTRLSTSGAYPSNNNYGVRCRYSSGDNKIYRNKVMVSSELPKGMVIGMYLGSDGEDPRISGVDVYDNEICVFEGHTNWVAPEGATGIGLDWINDLKVTNNCIVTDAAGVFSSRGQGRITISGNTFAHTDNPANWQPIKGREGWLHRGENKIEKWATDSRAPAVPKGLRVYKFMDSYLLRWDANAEKDVKGYFAWRDGKKLPISSRGGTFYVDWKLAKGKTATYALSAVDFSGNESAACMAVSTVSAINGLAYWDTEAARQKSAVPEAGKARGRTSVR